MKRLINGIKSAVERQVFVTTHSSLISTRLNLKKSILLNSQAESSISLKDIEESTANFFVKAPDNNLLEFILSKKIILVEGYAEFILMESFFERVKKQYLERLGVHIISVNGTSFERYLEIAKILKIKTAVIRDNDGDFQSNCVDNYKDYCVNEFIKIFYEDDDNLRTFENCIFSKNQEICNNMFSSGRRTLTVEDYMLKNKTNVALKLLENASDTLIIPEYIVKAIEWISE